MPTSKMHTNEAEIDALLVHRLLASQFPRWADLPIEPVDSAGTDNALYRLGEEMSVRLPRIPSAVGQIEKEHKWLPQIAPHLPLAVPQPLAKGGPGEGFPWPWSVYDWLEGENATRDKLSDLRQAAEDLAHFIAALRQIDPEGGPPPDPYNAHRGVPLAVRDAQTRAAITSVQDTFDSEALNAIWETALHAPAWDGPPVWIHGDLQAGNLLVKGGRLSAVIDFGCLGVGDPACELSVLWNFFTAETREVLRAILRVDEAAWRRGRGWALSIGLIAYPYYKGTNPFLAGIARYAIKETLEDFKRGL